MPNQIRRELVAPLMNKLPVAPAPTALTESSMLRSANIVELFETAGYDAKALQLGRVTTPVPTPVVAEGPLAKVQHWLAVVAEQVSQSRTTIARAARHDQVTDPLHDIRQAFSTFPMDTQRLKRTGAGIVPDWQAITDAYGKVLNGFKGGVCEDPDPEACENGLTVYFEGAEKFDLLAQDVLWRIANLRAWGGSFPPYLAALADDWFETIGLLGLPLSACVFYWGVEQTTACALEIAKYYGTAEGKRHKHGGEDEHPGVAEYARQQFQKLQAFRHQTELVASVERSRELVIASRRYWTQGRDLVMALGPFAGRAWELVESAWDAADKAKDAVKTALTNAAAVQEEDKATNTPAPAPPSADKAGGTTTAPPAPAPTPAPPATTPPPPPAPAPAPTTGGTGGPIDKVPVEHKPPLVPPRGDPVVSPFEHAVHQLVEIGRTDPHSRAFEAQAEHVINEARKLHEGGGPQPGVTKG